MPNETAVKLQTYVDSFTIDKEQRAVIRFFMLKELKARAIHTELESLYAQKRSLDRQ
jgi:hypothetical protein